MVKVITCKRPLLLLRIYALPKPKDFVTGSWDEPHGKLLSRHGLKMDIELRSALVNETGGRRKVHIAAHWLQSTAFSKVKTHQSCRVGFRNFCWKSVESKLARSEY